MMNDNITLIWMGLLSLCFLYVYMRLRRIESLLKCEQDNTILKPELTTFNNFLLYVVLTVVYNFKQPLHQTELRPARL